MGTPIGPTGSSAGLRPAGYAPPQQGVQMGPVTNMQPRYSQPGMSMVHPQAGMMHPMQQMNHMNGMNPMSQPHDQSAHQQLASALLRLGGSSA